MEAISIWMNETFGWGLTVAQAGAIFVGLIVVVLLAIFIPLIVVLKKKKKKKALMEFEEQRRQASSMRLSQTAVSKPTPVATPVVEKKVEPVTEPVVEEKVEEPVEEVAEPVEEVEEPKQEEIKEEVKEEPKQEEVKETVAEPVEEKKVAPKKAPAKKAESTNKEEVKKVMPVKKETPAKKPAPAKRAVGKWVIESKSADEYLAILHASNGEQMLTSETYTTEEGARNGIATIIKNVNTGRFVIYQDKNKNYYYKLKTLNNKLLCVGEIYKAKDQCLKAVESVKRIAEDAVVVDDVVKGTEYIDYVPKTINDADINEIIEKKVALGKWVIEQNEDGEYYAKLFASNGQLMLATEQSALRKTAENAIDYVKKNAKEGNFIIDQDKFGRFYYKLRNAQKSVICIGEAYDKLDSCISALESVRRFALTGVIMKDIKDASEAKAPAKTATKAPAKKAPAKKSN